MNLQFHVFVILLGLPLGFSTHFTHLNQGSGVTFTEIPCSRDKLTFPPNFDAVVELPVNVSTKGIILPTDGALILPFNSDLRLLAEDDRRCQESNDETLKVTQPIRFYWFNPDSWVSLLDGIASPDVELVPCANENIAMSVKEPISVDLDNVQGFSVGSINVDGREISASDLEKFFQTELGQIMFKSIEGTRVRSGSKSNCGCASVEDASIHEYWVCKHKGSCPVPKCLKPIVPLGYCCAVCGAALKIYVNECRSDDIALYNQFHDMVDMMNMRNKIDIYHSFFQEGDEKFEQVVLTDSSGYNEDSVRVMKAFISKNLTSYKHNAIYSGKSYVPNSGLNFWAIVFSAFLAVVGFFVILYAYYERNLLSFVSLPTVNRHRVFHTPFGFARFDNHPANDMEVPGNVVVGLGQENEGIRARGAREQPATGTTTSFHNPMFSENEMKSTEVMQASSANVEKDSAVKDGPEADLDIPEYRLEEIKNDDDYEDEEGLVEVDLDSEGSSE